MYRDSRAETSARVHLSSGEISFTFFKEGGNIEKISLCAVAPVVARLFPLLENASVCRCVQMVGDFFSVQVSLLYCCFAIGRHDGILLVSKKK